MNWLPALRRWITVFPSSLSERCEAPVAHPPRMEAMEPRRMFDAVAADDDAASKPKPEPEPGPTITQVFVNSTEWSQAFRNELQAEGLGSAALGYAVPMGERQLDDLPWANIDQVSLRFSESVTLDADAVRLRGRFVKHAGQDHGVGKQLKIESSTFDAATQTATVTLQEPLDRATVLRIQLKEKDVRDADGNPLDDKLDFRVNILPGDVNRDDIVNARDLVLTRNRIGRAIVRPGTGPTAYNVFTDVDGSGVINAIDLVLVRNNIGSGIVRDDKDDDDKGGDED